MRVGVKKRPARPAHQELNEGRSILAQLAFPQNRLFASFVYADLYDGTTRAEMDELAGFVGQVKVGSLVTFAVKPPKQFLASGLRLSMEKERTGP
jgi:hypothetical protein